MLSTFYGDAILTPVIPPDTPRQPQCLHICSSHSSCKASHTRVRVERCSPMIPAASSSLDIDHPPHLASRASFAPLLRIRSCFSQARMGKDPMRAVFDQRRGINWQRQRHDCSFVVFAVPDAVGPKCLSGAAAAPVAGALATAGPLACVCVLFRPLVGPRASPQARAITSGSSAALPSTLLVSVAFYEPK